MRIRSDIAILPIELLTELRIQLRNERSTVDHMRRNLDSMKETNTQLLIENTRLRTLLPSVTNTEPSE